MVGTLETYHLTERSDIRTLDLELRKHFSIQITPFRVIGMSVQEVVILLETAGVFMAIVVYRLRVLGVCRPLTSLCVEFSSF